MPLCGNCTFHHEGDKCPEMWEVMGDYECENCGYTIELPFDIPLDYFEGVHCGNCGEPGPWESIRAAGIKPET